MKQSHRQYGLQLPYTQPRGKSLLVWKVPTEIQNTDVYRGHWKIPAAQVSRSQIPDWYSRFTLDLQYLVTFLRKTIL